MEIAGEDRARGSDLPRILRKLAGSIPGEALGYDAVHQRAEHHSDVR